MPLAPEHRISAPADTTKTSFNKYLLSYSHQLMIDRIPTPVLLCDRHFIITHANRASLALLHMPGAQPPVAADRLIGMSLHDFCGAWVSYRVTLLENPRGECDGAFVDWEITPP